MTRRFLRACLLAVVAAAAVFPMLATGVATAYPGAPWFQPSHQYTGNFPDPTVMRVGSTYYAYSTATGGANLPVETSTDLVHWTARPAYNAGAPYNSDPYYNDALPAAASWAPALSAGRLGKGVWAPGVVHVGTPYLDYYAVQARVSPARWCLSVATSSSPLGPFRDTTRGPLQCDADPAGSIDPSPFLDTNGRLFLLWKSEGVPGHAPTKIWIRPMTADGLAFYPGSRPTLLLQTDQRWEGNVIESPSMVRTSKGLFLFYSGNEWASSHYAIGYAICSGPGSCHKVPGPLLGSVGNRLGPGGPSAFTDTAGHLRLAFHYWNAPYTNYPSYPACVSTSSCTTQGQRRLAVASLKETAYGLVFG